MSRPTELISLGKDKSVDPRFSVCYARGSVFKAEGNFFRVEKGSRALVDRALCLSSHCGKRCAECPNHNFTVRFVAGGVCSD